MVRTAGRAHSEASARVRRRPSGRWPWRRCSRERFRAQRGGGREVVADGEDPRQCYGHAASRSYRGRYVEVSSAASAADSVPLYSPQSCERGPRERNAWRLPRRLLGMIFGTSGPGLSRAILTRCGQKREGGASQARRPTSPNGFRSIGSQRLTRDRLAPILCILLQEGEISSPRLPCPNKIVIANSPRQTRPPSSQLGDSLPISDRMNWASSTLNAAVLCIHQLRFSISPRS